MIGQPRTLGEVLTGMSQTGQHALEIVKTAVDEGLTGADLHHTLVISGVSLGVKEAEAHYMGGTKVMLDTLRECVGYINSTLPQLDDPGSEEIVIAIKFMRDRLQKVINDRASNLAAARLEELTGRYDVPGHYITDAPQPRKEHEMEALGFRLASANTLHFHGWSQAVLRDAIGAMSCRCEGCYTTFALAGASDKTPADLLGELMPKFGGLSEVFSAFGEAAIADMRSQYTKMLDGTLDGTEHAKEPIDAKTLASEVISKIREARGE